MKNNRRILALLLVIVAVFSLAACGQKGESATTPAPESSIKVADLAGNEVEVKNVKKVVSLSPSTTEILYAIGAGDMVVGVDAFSNYPENVVKTVVGDFEGPNVEKILELEPDVVFADEKMHADAISQLKAAGVTVIAVEAREYSEIEKSIEIIGKVTDKNEEAKKLTESMAKVEEEVKEAAKSFEKKTVYYVVSFGDAGNWTSGPGSFINEMIKVAGGHPVTEDASPSAPWMEYSVEALVEDNPDIIIMSFGDKDDLAKTDGFKDLKAVKDGKIYVIDTDIVSRPGPRVSDALKAIQAILKEAK